MRLTDLADHLRTSGLEVVEVRGWRTRGAELMAMPDTIIAHHTATSAKAKGDIPSLRLLVDGRSDLPGPLCQLGLSRTGVVYMVASGKANHAGRGEWAGQTSSARTIGIEAENDGLGKPWNVKQLDAYERLCAAVCVYLGVGPERVCGHREWARPLGRKPDPAGIDLDAFRDRVRSHLSPTPAPDPPLLEEDDVSFIFNDGTKTYLRDGGFTIHIPERTDASNLTKGAKDVGRLSAEMTKRLIEASR